MAIKATVKAARRRRRDPTEAEKRLWRALRETTLPGKVRRQHPVGGYVVDFAIPACGLAIEIDGGQHAKRVREDARRTAEIERRGFRVLRFWNHEVMGNMEGVLEAVHRETGPLEKE